MISITHGRSNRWLITPEPYEVSGFRSFYDLRGEDLDARLRALNDLGQRAHLCVDFSDYEQLYHLHVARPVEPQHLQRLALLVNHHACLYLDQLPLLPEPTFKAQVRQRVLDFGNHIEEQAVDRYGVGATHPALWVLGEQANPRAASFPFPFGTTAGNRMLWPHVNPWTTRVSNVLEPYETVSAARTRTSREWRALGEPMVLLLGNTAARLFGTSRNVLGYLEHPQFVWRFHHSFHRAWSQQFIEYQHRAVEGAG